MPEITPAEWFEAAVALGLTVVTAIVLYTVLWLVGHALKIKVGDRVRIMKGSLTEAKGTIIFIDGTMLRVKVDGLRTGHYSVPRTWVSKVRK